MTTNERNTVTSTYVKVNHKLPQEVVDACTKIGEDTLKRNAYIRLLRKNEWSLQSIADAVGGLTRERIRQIVVGSYDGSDTAESLISSSGLIIRVAIRSTI